MGEIKSTIDIVMEKTKHLSMTDEEKKENEKENVRSAVKGLVQKYQDQTLNVAAFQKELNLLHQQYSFKDSELLANEMFSRFDIEEDNRLLLELIERILKINPNKLEEMLNQFKDGINGLAKNRIEDLKNELKENYFISGSAVIPNVKADPALQSEINDLKSQFRIRLDEVKSEIVNQ